MASKMEKTLARLQQRIQEGQFYEAHQQLRVVASRYVKQENYQAAVDVIYTGAQALLKAGQGGSGGDLCLFLVDALKNGDVEPDAATKGKLLTLLRLFSPEEPSRKRYIGDMIAWTSKCGEFPAGDPEFHHVAGSLFAEEHEPYDAERHLILGTRDSAEILARMEYDWYAEDDSHTAPVYAARTVLPYLLVGNVRDANKSLQVFTSLLTERSKSLGSQQVSSASADVRIFPSLPLLNFLSLLLLAVQRGSADLFRQLRSHYATHLKEIGTWDDALDQVGEMYFGIEIPRQSNPLLDMMGNLFGGGGSGQTQKPKTRRIEAPSAPPSMELD